MGHKNKRKSSAVAFRMSPKAPTFSSLTRSRRRIREEFARDWKWANHRAIPMRTLPPGRQARGSSENPPEIKTSYTTPILSLFPYNFNHPLYRLTHVDCHIAAVFADNRFRQTLTHAFFKHVLNKFSVLNKLLHTHTPICHVITINFIYFYNIFLVHFCRKLFSADVCNR